MPHITGCPGSSRGSDVGGRPLTCTYTDADGTDYVCGAGAELDPAKSPNSRTCCVATRLRLPLNRKGAVRYYDPFYVDSWNSCCRCQQYHVAQTVDGTTECVEQTYTAKTTNTLAVPP